MGSINYSYVLIDHFTNKKYIYLSIYITKYNYIYLTNYILN